MSTDVTGGAFLSRASRYLQRDLNPLKLKKYLPKSRRYLRLQEKSRICLI